MIATGDIAGVLWSTLPLALVAGAHAATWGAFKDSPYEGYHPLRQLRTLVVAALAAVFATLAGLVDPHTMLPAIGVVYALERLSTEWWKTILRADDQSAYTIPMRLGFGGRPVDLDWLRYGAGAFVVLVLVGLGAAVHTAQNAFGELPWWVIVPTVGGLGGWATACGGAWKDAPFEGFSGWKFIRSPAVATAWAVPLSLMTSSWVTLCVAAGGLAVFSIETYKTFWTGGRAPGKFADRPQRDPLGSTRHLMGRLHAGAWMVFAAIVLTGALSGMARSLPTTDTSGVGSLGSSDWIDQLGASDLLSGFTVSILVSVGALLVAGCVLRSSRRLTNPAVVHGAPPTARSQGVELPVSM